MDEPGGSYTFAHGARKVAPFSIAVFGFGVSFGVLAEPTMGRVAPIVMSSVTFAGSAQFAAASILQDGGTLGAAVIAAVLLNARYGPIGVSVAPSITGPWWSRLLKAQLVVDETWALSADGRGGHDAKIIVGAGLVLYAAWVTGTVAGVLFGDLVGDPARWGLDAAFPALFLALLIPNLDRPHAKPAAIVGAAIALALTPIAPAGVPIVAAGLACLIGWRR
ncbi:MAG TPA: AzlC family ABC transporter permease [Actinomycetota bacterium]|nr:AzlC family ABC transporter permease [Actinomycetota bacterium]